MADDVPGHTGIDGDPLASIGARIVARLLDWFVLLGLWIPLVALSAQDNAEGDPTIPRWVVLVWVAMVVVYETGFVAWRGQTPGKMVMGIAIVDLADGSVPSPGAALARVVVIAFCLAVLGVFFPVVAVFVYFSAGFMQHSRGVLDRLAGTVVVARRLTAAKSVLPDG